MGPNDQSQQQMGGTISSDQAQGADTSQQSSFQQPSEQPQVQEPRGMPDQSVAGPEPMPEALGRTASGAMDVTPPQPSGSSPTGEVSMGATSGQANLETPSHYGADQETPSVGGQVSEEVQSEPGEDGNPPQGI